MEDLLVEFASKRLKKTPKLKSQNGIMKLVYEIIKAYTIVIP